MVILLLSGQGTSGLLSALDTEARDIQGQAMAKGTYKNLFTQIRTFLTYCLYANMAFLPVSSEDLIRYIVFLARSFNSFTAICNYLNGVRFLHVSNGLRFTLLTDFHVALTLRGVKKCMSSKPPLGTKLPITVPILHHIFSFIHPDNPLHVSLWAAFLVGFFGFLRKSNLVPPICCL